MTKEHSDNEVFANSDNVKDTWKVKIYRRVMFIAFLLMGLGNWADTKSLLTEGYEGFIANFTNLIEERAVSNVYVGNYIEYVELDIGIPQVVKKSSIDSSYEYRFYKKDKYLLTLIVKSERISSVILHSLPVDSFFLSGFNPSVPLGEHYLNQSSISDIVGDGNVYFFDNQNLKYFMADKPLGSHYMGIHLLVGFSEYGRGDILQEKLLAKLSDAELFEDTSETELIVSELEESPATFYATSELSGDYIADALLTRFEFKTYFKG